MQRAEPASMLNTHISTDPAFDPIVERVGIIEPSQIDARINAPSASNQSVAQTQPRAESGGMRHEPPAGRGELVRPDLQVPAFGREDFEGHRREGIDIDLDFGARCDRHLLCAATF
ncbi:MAG: hypothetical protein AAGK78_16550 [Planctomycetota bacterium]